jgi:hypothetical protein
MAADEYDVTRWRARAAEARTLADQLTHPEAKRLMLEIAEKYERLASAAESQRGKTP